jgi:tetratricopeptide (TPR) repeat protein
MTSPAPAAELTSANASTAGESLLARRLFLVLGAIALIYACVAGWRTVADPDVGWQLATGRWVAQHHHVFSTDVFSFTAQGQPWIYPVGSGLIFYATYLLGGYTLLSWFGLLACVGTVALLLRRGSAFTAAIAILAVPLIAPRTSPRAEMFTVVLFAAYLSILWEHHQTGRARLWLLPALMVAWVNLHLGFIAGLALIVGFAGLEVLEMISSPQLRSESVAKLRRLAAWFVASVVATLVNPWGWGIYKAIVLQNRAMKVHSQAILEWAGLHWTSTQPIWSFLREPVRNTLVLLMVVVLVTGFVAVQRRRWGAAILVVGAMYASVKHLRMEALTACVVVVVGGAILSEAIPEVRAWLPDARMRSGLAIAAVVLVAALAVVRAEEFISNRVYLASDDIWSFGMGSPWWAPQRAAEFVLRENLPANVFTSFDAGGFLLWKLGAKYQDYIDGRAIPFGADLFQRERMLLATPIDSAAWTEEADRYNINTIIFSFVANEVSFDQLQDLCYAENWKPVYLDELAIVLVRRTPQTADLISRLQVSCPVATLPGGPLDRSARSFPQWVNTAEALLILRRNAEALTAADNAAAIFPDSARVHGVRGGILYSLHRRQEAEQEWLKSLALSPADSAGNAGVWARLGDLYDQQGRTGEAIHAYQQAIRLTADPLKPRTLIKLARLYLMTHEPQAALNALDDAVKFAPAQTPGQQKGRSFAFDVAQGRAASWRGLGDVAKAISYEEEAVKLDPDAADAWSHLAKLYQQGGRTADAQQAEARAKALGTPESH